VPSAEAGQADPEGDAWGAVSEVGVRTLGVGHRSAGGDFRAEMDAATEAAPLRSARPTSCTAARKRT